jgi:cell division protein FtsQ
VPQAVKYKVKIEPNINKFKLLTYSLIIILILGIIFAYNLLPIQTVEVKFIFGNENIEQQFLQKTINNFTQQNFFKINLKNLTKSLLKLDWVKHVEIKRVFPFNLLIEISEYKPITYWYEIRNKSNKWLIDEHGVLFKITHKSYIKYKNKRKLPILSGLTNNYARILKNFLHIQNLFNPIDLKIKELNYDKFGTGRLVLNNNLLIILNKQKFKFLQQFVNIYQNIQNKNIKYIDLRYANGMAISYKKHD